MRTGAAVAALSVFVAGCGARSGTPTSQAGRRADVIVSVDAVHHVCSLALAKEEQGNSVACGEIIPFLKEELRVPAGATYDVRSTAEISDAELAGIKERLNAAGYRFLGAR